MSHPATGRLRGQSFAPGGVLARGRDVLRSLGGPLAERASRGLEDLFRPRLLRQALASLERGNLEAAFWLLREALSHRPDDVRAARTFWEVAVACGRPEQAAGTMTRLVHRLAATGHAERAADAWMALEGAVRDAPVDALTLARVLPSLAARMERARGEPARQEARGWLVRAMRRSVEPGAGLSGGLALRLFEQARGVDREAARRAAAVALASPELHATKRARLEAELAELEAGPDPAEAPAPPPPAASVTEAVALELGPAGLVLRETASGLRTRIDPVGVAAVCVARVAGLGPEPVRVVDLVVPAGTAGRGPSLVRLRTDAFDPNVAPQADGAEDALRAFLAELLERSGAVPLPDPDAVLGLQPTDVVDRADHERGLAARVGAAA